VWAEKHSCDSTTQFTLTHSWFQSIHGTILVNFIHQVNWQQTRKK